MNVLSVGFGKFVVEFFGGDDMYLGRLRDLREDKDLKQADIAKLLQITQQQYQLYESGKRDLPLRFACVLAEYYNVSMDYLCGLIDTPRRLR